MKQTQRRVLIIGDSALTRASVRAVLRHSEPNVMVDETGGEPDSEQQVDLVVAVAPVSSNWSLPPAAPVIAVGETAVERAAAHIPLTPEHLGRLPLLVRAVMAEEAFTMEQDARRAAEARAAQWEERAAESTRLNHILRAAAGALSAGLDRTQVLDLILSQLERVLRYDSASVLLVDGDALVNVSRRSKHDNADKSRRMPLAGFPHLRQVVVERAPVIIADTQTDPRWQRLPGIDTIRCWLGVPLLVEGEVIGVLNLTRGTPHYYDEAAAELTLLFANQAAVAIRNARLFSQTEARVRALNLLNQVISTAANHWEERDTLQMGCEALADYFGIESDRLRVMAAMVDDEGDKQRVAAFAGQVDGRYRAGQIISADSWPGLEQVMTHGRVIVGPENDKGERGMAWLIAPILVRDRVVGTLRIDFDEKRLIEPETRRLIQTIGEELGRNLETGRLYAYLQQHAADLENRVQERTRALAAANTRLTELDRLKSRFIADMSHELRTPVSNLHLYLDLLQRGKPEKRAHYQAVLRAQADRLEQLVASIFDLLQLERQPEDVLLKPLLINSLVADVVESLQEQAGTSGLDLTFVPAAGEPQVEGEASHLQRLVNNLVTNAIQFTPSGWVRVAIITGETGLFLTVSDSGPGIASDDRPHLFDRFYRGRQAAQMNIPGIGLGLSIVREIAERHGGRVEWNSEVGSGTTFRVWLPTVG